MENLLSFRIFTGKLLLSVFLLLFICSCSSKKEFTMENVSSLQDSATIYASRVEWAEPPESAELSEKNPSININLCQNPYAIIASQTEIQTSYPYLDGFGSLDISSYTQAQLACINDFCSCLESGKSADSYISKGFLFTLALFKYNMKQSGRDIAKIKSHIVGKPFMQNEQCQCPVRLLMKDNSFCDVYIFLVKSTSDWKINQIDFKNSGE